MLKQVGRCNDLAQNGTGAHELHALLGFFGAGFQTVQAFENALFLTWLQPRMAVVFVHQGDVIKHVFLIADHAAQTIMQNHPDFMREGRVIRHAVGNGRGKHVTVTIFVLQAFPVEGSAPSGTAKQKATRAHVACRPSQVANALQAKHGIESIERNHRPIVGRVRCGRGNPRTHRTGFVDPFLQNLSGLVFAIVADLIFINRLIELPLLTENADLTEQTFHTKGARFVDQNRHDTITKRGVAQQNRQHADIGLGG